MKTIFYFSEKIYKLSQALAENRIHQLKEQSKFILDFLILLYLLPGKAYVRTGIRIPTFHLFMERKFVKTLCTAPYREMIYKSVAQ